MTILDQLAGYARERTALAKEKVPLEKMRERALAMGMTSGGGFREAAARKGGFACEAAARKGGFACEAAARKGGSTCEAAARKEAFPFEAALRKPGISVQRAGTDVVVILVRDAIMELDVADISPDGADTLKTIAKILKKYDATFMEIAGYTDAMRNYQAADALSMDMAQRVGVFLAQHDIDTTRMFIVGRGAARPIAAQDDIGRLTNRRVEIRIVPAR